MDFVLYILSKSCMNLVSAKEVKHTDSLYFVDGLWECQFHGERKLESFNAGTGSHRPSDEK